eukprot:GHVN01077245.1.p1 GENE.GHVN01077245.1~~GHVN01077245.1.p1  ORF type:complete len:761 (+),score=83.17 GHVN01077245.1:246-2528(+)
MRKSRCPLDRGRAMGRDEPNTRNYDRNSPVMLTIHQYTGSNKQTYTMLEQQEILRNRLEVLEDEIVECRAGIRGGCDEVSEVPGWDALLNHLQSASWAPNGRLLTESAHSFSVCFTPTNTPSLIHSINPPLSNYVTQSTHLLSIQFLRLQNRNWQISPFSNLCQGFRKMVGGSIRFRQSHSQTGLVADHYRGKQLFAALQSQNRPPTFSHRTTAHAGSGERKSAPNTERHSQGQTQPQFAPSHARHDGSSLQRSHRHPDREERKGGEGAPCLSSARLDVPPATPSGRAQPGPAKPLKRLIRINIASSPRLSRPIRASNVKASEHQMPDAHKGSPALSKRSASPTSNRSGIPSTTAKLPSAKPHRAEEVKKTSQKTHHRIIPNLDEALSENVHMAVPVLIPLVVPTETSHTFPSELPHHIPFSPPAKPTFIPPTSSKPALHVSHCPPPLVPPLKTSKQTIAPEWAAVLAPYHGPFLEPPDVDSRWPLTVLPQTIIPHMVQCPPPSTDMNPQIAAIRRVVEDPLNRGFATVQSSLAHQPDPLLAPVEHQTMMADTSTLPDSVLATPDASELPPPAPSSHQTRRPAISIVMGFPSESNETQKEVTAGSKVAPNASHVPGLQQGAEALSPASESALSAPRDTKEDRNQMETPRGVSLGPPPDKDRSIQVDLRAAGPSNNLNKEGEKKEVCAAVPMTTRGGRRASNPSPKASPKVSPRAKRGLPPIPVGEEPRGELPPATRSRRGSASSKDVQALASQVRSSLIW